MEEQILDTTLEDPEVPDSLPVGATLQNGRYRILEKLSQGSFGITYRAESNRGIVAIKEFFLQNITQRSELNTSVTGSQGQEFQYYKKKFIVEARNLAKMSQYDDIVNVYDVFEENNTAYYSMEFIDGGSLDDYIKQCGKIPENQAIEYISKIASALKHLHDHNMLHLDLKPKNIMRRSDGKLYLIDFGLSKQYDESGKAESSRTVGLGSPGYAPIEQANFKGGFAPTLDIYALGATFYKMLTGVTPPVSSDIFDDGFGSLLQKMRSVGISDKTIAIVEKAMQLRKVDRYQNVGEFLAALGQVSNTKHQNNQSDNTQRATPPQYSPSSSYSNDETKTRTLSSTYINEEKKGVKHALLEFSIYSGFIVGIASILGCIYFYLILGKTGIGNDDPWCVYGSVASIGILFLVGVCSSYKKGGIVSGILISVISLFFLVVANTLHDFGAVAFMIVSIVHFLLGVSIILNHKEFEKK